MGGAGTWRLASAHPERFAAIAPICGWGESSIPGASGTSRPGCSTEPGMTLFPSGQSGDGGCPQAGGQ
jgi:pimeloyl-ACP methyl ester carboxylesterase